MTLFHSDTLGRAPTEMFLISNNPTRSHPARNIKSGTCALQALSSPSNSEARTALSDLADHFRDKPFFVHQVFHLCWQKRSWPLVPVPFLLTWYGSLRSPLGFAWSDARITLPSPLAYNESPQFDRKNLSCPWAIQSQGRVLLFLVTDKKIPTGTSTESQGNTLALEQTKTS